MITKISWTKRFRKDFDSMPMGIREKIAAWIFGVETLGLHEVARRPGYHDEPLKGQRFGQRSIRLNRAYRLIYRVIEDRVHIELLEVNKHEY